MSDLVIKPVTYNCPQWRCIYCQGLFPHIVSASAHFDECPGLALKQSDPNQRTAEPGAATNKEN